MITSMKPSEKKDTIIQLIKVCNNLEDCAHNLEEPIMSLMSNKPGEKAGLKNQYAGSLTSYQEIIKNMSGTIRSYIQEIQNDD